MGIHHGISYATGVTKWINRDVRELIIDPLENSVRTRCDLDWKKIMKR